MKLDQKLGANLEDLACLNFKIHELWLPLQISLLHWSRSKYSLGEISKVCHIIYKMTATTCLTNLWAKSQTEKRTNTYRMSAQMLENKHYNDLRNLSVYTYVLVCHFKSICNAMFIIRYLWYSLSSVLPFYLNLGSNQDRGKPGILQTWYIANSDSLPLAGKHPSLLRWQTPRTTRLTPGSCQQSKNN